MGREIRRVPKGWEHPRDVKGNYKPMEDETVWQGTLRILRHELWDYLSCPRYWREGLWLPFMHREYYRPRSRQPQTCYQIYETVSEGTPVSPVFTFLTDLEDWLVAEGYSRKSAERFAQDGWAPSMVMNINPAGGSWIANDIHALGVLPAAGKDDNA